MKNPLNKRFIRELRNELGKYIVLFLFIVTMISIVSGFLVASHSMIKAYEESFEKYNIEDGNFELKVKADEDIICRIEENNITVYENFYLEEDTDYDATLRIFKNRNEVDQVCLMEGNLPEKNNEIAIDRLHAKNNKLSINDTIILGDKEFVICGLVSLSDYSALYQNPTDTMFDATKFGVSIVTKEGFEDIGDTHIHYSYSWKYDESPLDKEQAKEMGDKLLGTISKIAFLEEFIPAYNNQAIQFSGNDMGRDTMLFTVFLYVLVAIIAFIFAITTSNTIARESTVIGTMRASGYTKGELIRHYLAIPMMVTFFAALVGNLLGYTLLEDYAADMYYNSYCLTSYELLLNGDAFINTTVIPLVIMFLINYFILVSKFKLSPLRFIRRDLGKRNGKKAFKLNTKIGIMKRFRCRIIFQNIPNYITIVIGVFLANIIMLFGNAFPALLDHYGESIGSSMICEYQYILKNPVETEIKSSEKHTIYALRTLEKRGFSEVVSVFGVAYDSKYIELDFSRDGVYVSSAYADKYDVKVGDKITLKEEFANTEYEFYIGGIYDYSIGIAVFIEQEELNRIFGLPEGYYNGYFSEEKLVDIDERAIATVISEDDMTKLTRQLKNSMGSIMDLFFVAGVMIFMLVIYLLSKIVVEKNSQSISMIKILGYTSKEINGLYVVTTAIVVVVSLILTMPVVDAIMGYLCEIMFFTYSGWLTYYMPTKSILYIILVGILSYGVIAFMQMRNVKRIPMEEALKNVE